jgi:uncharacterized phage-associated protein
MGIKQGTICIVESIFDVALWFADTALEQNEYLQPQKLHRLLYLSQGYYAVAFGGRKLMPAVFIAEEMGPMEPNVYKAFAKGRPNIEPNIFLPDGVDHFLSGIWSRFGHNTPDRLAKMCKESLAFKQALKRGARTEIPLQAMLLSFARAEGTPAATQVIKPKMMRSQSGRPVAVKRWVPGS